MMCTEKELTFSTFIFYILSEAWNKTPAEVYKVLNSTGILDGHIIEAYDVLHTLGKTYLVEDITELAREKGINILLVLSTSVNSLQLYTPLLDMKLETYNSYPS